jgi:hypothetical protein
VTHVVVDGANVVGSRPDGWWRDRAGAAQRLAARLAVALDGAAPDGADPDGDGDPLARALGVSGDVTLHLVLEGAARGADPVPHPRLRLVRAERDGDGAIVALTRDLGGNGVLVVTADRGLRDRVHALGATTAGPSTLLAALPGPDTAP